MIAALGSAAMLRCEWVLVLLVLVAAATSALPASVHPALAIGHDALPYLLLPSSLVFAHAVWCSDWWLAATSMMLVGAQLGLLVPRLRPAPLPPWSARVPQLQVVACNVFVGNRTPHLLARELVHSGADVLVLTEWNPRFAAAFEDAAGDMRFPHRLVDTTDCSEYSVCIASSRQFTQAQMVQRGVLKYADATVPCGEGQLQILGLNADAIVDRGGYRRWRSQLRSLVDTVPELAPAAVVAGDFNTTRFRPEFRALLRAGLIDAHGARGEGLSRSFKLAARGPLSFLGALVRLDHAFLTADVCAVSVENLDPCGSDHLPFRITLAVRPSVPPASDPDFSESVADRPADLVRV